MAQVDETARIGAGVQLGEGVIVRAFANLYGCTIRDESRIGPWTEIRAGAQIGERCKIANHVTVGEDTVIGNGVFVGPGVVFCNDRLPRATNPDGTLVGKDDWTCEPPRVEDKASIGAGCMILPGVTIGEGALVGAGSVVVKDVRPWTVVAGNPARFVKELTPP